MTLSVPIQRARVAPPSPRLLQPVHLAARTRFALSQSSKLRTPPKLPFWLPNPRRNRRRVRSRQFGFTLRKRAKMRRGFVRLKGELSRWRAEVEEAGYKYHVRMTSRKGVCQSISVRRAHACSYNCKLSAFLVLTGKLIELVVSPIWKKSAYLDYCTEQQPWSSD